jgi:hypothetical protein
MGEEFYSIIKLTSGEEIFALVSIDENDGDTVLILQSPVEIKTFHHNGNTVVKVKPWIELSTEDLFVIRLDKVITMTESKDQKLIDIYIRYLEDDETEDYTFSNKVDVSSTVGYLSSVEDARKSLENLYNNTKDSKES